MDVRELESALKNKLGPYIKFIGVYTSDNLPVIPYNTKPIVLTANTLRSSANIDTVGHWVGYYFEFYLKRRVIFFDSFGLSPHFYINCGFSSFLRKYRDTPIYNFGTQFQPDNSMKCKLFVSLLICSLYFHVWSKQIHQLKKKKWNWHIMINMLEGTISNIYQNHTVHIGKMEIRELYHTRNVFHIRVCIINCNINIIKLFIIDICIFSYIFNIFI